MADLRPCPSNSFRFNTTLCACNPGYVMNSAADGCSLFVVSSSGFVVSSGIDYSINFPETIFSFDSLKKFTQSQALFLEATLVMLLSWLAFCFFVRFGKLDEGRSIWFRIRWWISRLDFCFATRHWLDDHKVVIKRKTELGGTFSVASWILFIGLFAALLYQIISNRTVEVHNVRATNAPDLLSFTNDLEFNITTISSMSCSHLRGLGNLASGTPGFVDYRVSPLPIFANYSCRNTTLGPTISLACKNCRIIPDNLYISWHFIDLPNNPASAVGFQFNLTAKKHGDRKRVSFVSGTLKNGSNMDDRPVTFRGADVNILKFNLFPRIYHNLHDLRLIQPVFHEFRPGSSFLEASQLQASLQSGKDGLINTTLFVNFLSAYIIEVDSQNILGPVGFLADLGGLYAICIATFFYCLVQCEFRIKKLRDEDNVLRNIRSRKKAQERWEKLRKYVMYTWSHSTQDDYDNNDSKEACCGNITVDPIRRSKSSYKRKQPFRIDSIGLNQKLKSPMKKSAIPERAQTQRVQSYLAGSTTNIEGSYLHSEGENKDGKNGQLVASCEGAATQPQSHIPNEGVFPPPTALEFNSGTETDLSDIKKNLQNLYEYNVLLREKFLTTQSMLEALSNEASNSGK